MSIQGGAEIMHILVGLFLLVVLIGLMIGIGSVILGLGSKNKQQSRDSGFNAKQLHFAAVTLTGIGFLFALSMAMYFYGGENSPGKQIFDACKTILPPIIALILGFYFGKETRPESDPGRSETGAESEP